jgi:hypothetical protein|tara:strand:- start:4457 stop:4684 length:228 start_codon:yes stop_codon:yes gene_type:complete
MYKRDLSTKAKSAGSSLLQNISSTPWRLRYSLEEDADEMSGEAPVGKKMSCIVKTAFLSIALNFVPSQFKAKARE